MKEFSILRGCTYRVISRHDENVGSTIGFFPTREAAEKYAKANYGEVVAINYVELEGVLMVDNHGKAQLDEGVGAITLDSLIIRELGLTSLAGAEIGPVKITISPVMEK